MANTKSAKKRIEINRRNYLKNRFYKSSVKTLTKTFLKTLELYKISENLEDKRKLYETLNLIYSMIDKGTKKKVFQKNTAARKKARLFKNLVALQK